MYFVYLGDTIIIGAALLAVPAVSTYMVYVPSTYNIHIKPQGRGVTDEVFFTTRDTSIVQQHFGVVEHGNFVEYVYSTRK